MQAEAARELILQTLKQHPAGLCIALVLREHRAEASPRRALFLKAVQILERRGQVAVSGPGGFTTLVRSKGGREVAGALVRLRQDQPAPS
jgi:hypothetical protein